MCTTQLIGRSSYFASSLVSWACSQLILPAPLASPDTLATVIHSLAILTSP